MTNKGRKLYSGIQVCDTCGTCQVVRIRDNKVRKHQREVWEDRQWTGAMETCPGDGSWTDPVAENHARAAESTATDPNTAQERPMPETDPTDLPVLPPGAHWQQIPSLLDQDVAAIQARVDDATPGHWCFAPEPHLPPGTMQTNVDGYNRLVGRLEHASPADQELILRAHADLTFLLTERARLKAELAESAGRTAALAEAAVAVINVRGPLIHQDSIYAAYDAVRRIDDPDAPSIHDQR